MIRIRRIRDHCIRGRRSAKRDLEREGDEGVEEREEEVGEDGGAPAPDDELVEVQRSVARGDEFHVDGEVEGE